MNVVLNSKVVILVRIPPGNGTFCFQMRESNHMGRTIHQRYGFFAVNLFLLEILRKTRYVTT